MIKRRVVDLFPVEERLQTEAKKFFELVRKAERILISSTLTSDGDSVGAQLALLNLIGQIRKEDAPPVWIVNQVTVPERYRFLKNVEKIVSWDEWNALEHKPNFDLGIVTDGGVERTGDVQVLFKGINNTVLVDHHAVGSKLKYSSTLLDLEASSSCELTYLLFELAGAEISPSVAEAIYVGMVFDTGFFKHSLTKPRTHYVAAGLIGTGIDFSKISDRAILERSWEGQLLLRMMLANMRRTECNRIVYSSWSLEELSKVKTKDGDQEGAINQLYYTEGTEVVLLFVEMPDNQVKISFRSKGKVNVAEFARTCNAEGGGHVRAAGCTMTGNFEKVKVSVIENLKKLLNQTH